MENNVVKEVYLTWPLFVLIFDFLILGALGYMFIKVLIYWHKKK